MTTRTYTTEAERQAALAAAQADYRRTGVLHTPIPAELAEHQRTRYRPAPFGVDYAAPPPPAKRGATAEQVAEVVAEAVACFTDHAAQSLVARRLRELGGDDAVMTVMRQVADERAQRARQGW